MGYQISQDNTTEPLLFLLVRASDHITPLTGASPTVVVSKNGGAFASPLGAISEVGNGWYAVAAHASDASTLGPLTLHATATSADPTDDQYSVVDPLAHATPLPGVPTTGVVSFTASTLIAGALRLIGALAGGETLDPDDAATGLDVLNELLDGFQTESLLLYSDARTVLPLTIGQSTYTIGATGADLTTTRPLAVTRAGFLLPNGYEYPLRVLTLQQYASISNKASEATYPRSVWYSATFPTGTLTVWPAPTTPVSLTLYASVALGYVTSLTDMYQLPPGYLRMLRYTLAVALASEYGVAAPGTVLQGASEAKAAVKRQNLRLDDLSLADVSGLGRRGRMANSVLDGGVF